MNLMRGRLVISKDMGGRLDICRKIYCLPWADSLQLGTTQSPISRPNNPSPLEG
jgi:hypothetical protein